MRKILTQLLVVLVCMPYLACAMPACGHGTAVAQPEIPPCADHDNLVVQPGQESADVMFLQDCAGVDVPIIQYDSSLQKKDFKSDGSAIVEREPALCKAHASLKINVSPIWDSTSHPPPNIVLATQRFRL
jgi:hypothetical protein